MRVLAFFGKVSPVAGGGQGQAGPARIFAPSLGRKCRAEKLLFIELAVSYPWQPAPELPGLRSRYSHCPPRRDRSWPH